MIKSNQKKQLFAFGEFILDTHERRLEAHGKSVALTPKVFDLLVLLVQNPGRLLEKQWLLSTLWPETFVEEANLSVNISTLRKALEAAGGENLIETVPKRGYRFTGHVNELTTPAPGSIMAESAPVSEKKRWLPISIVGVLALIALSIVTERAWFRRPIESPSEVMSLAVLPFRPLAGNFEGEDELLGPGMADAVIRKLSLIEKIQVRATSSIQKYSGAHVDPVAAGRDLHVDVVLDGKIQHADKTIRVSVQLLRVSDGNPIWADRFDDYYTNLFAVQDSISEKVANALKIQLTQADHRKMAKPATRDTLAFELYMKGKYCAMQRTSDTPAETCAALFEQAVARDPDFALAYAGLAGEYLRIGSTGAGPDATERARAAANKAVSLDYDAPESHLASGDVLFRGDWDWFGAEREFDRALALDINSSASHRSIASLRMALGETERALAEMQQARSLDPASAEVRDDLAWAFYCNRRYVEAIQESLGAIAMAPRSYGAHRQLGKEYLHAGRYSEAQTEFETAIKLGLPRVGVADLGQTFAITRRTAQAHQALDELKQSGPSRANQADYLLAVLQGALGDKSGAFISLQQAVGRKLPAAIWMRADPDMDPLRGDPRFDALLRRVHLVN